MSYQTGPGNSKHLCWIHWEEGRNNRLTVSPTLEVFQTMSFSMPSFLLSVKIIPIITLQTKWALQLLLLFGFVPLRLHSSHARYAMSSSYHPSYMYNLIGTICDHSPLYYHIKNISAYLHALWPLCSAVASFASKRFLHKSFIFLIHFSLHFFFLPPPPHQDSLFLFWENR